MENNKTKTTDTLSEKGELIAVGVLPIYARPLTVLQVQEIGELVDQMGECETTEGQLLSNYAFKNSKSAGAIADIVVKSLFRGSFNRLILGWYIRKHLDSNTLRKCIAHIQKSFDFGFFFTASVFLRGMKKTQKTEKKTETTLGDSWVES